MTYELMYGNIYYTEIDARDVTPETPCLHSEHCDHGFERQG
jgi:hypothetical protein